jgi:hypothetical protein
VVTPVQHFVRNADGTLTSFIAVPFMSLQEAREAGPQKMADPNFVQAKIDAALKAAADSAAAAEGKD